MIKVSICMITYNHEKYIAQAIEGILMQKTNFDFEIVIGEDCSTDNTRKIISEFSYKYPGKFKLILHKNNIGAMANQIAVLQYCTGKYIACCEGDDYWTDPYKLQKQVDFLEGNPDFAICHHNVQVIYDDNRKSCFSNSSSQKEVTIIEDLAQENYISAVSCVFRNGLIKEFPEWFKNTPIGDYPLHMLNSQYGKIKYIPDVMGVYRVHKEGIWGGKNSIYQSEKLVELIDLMKNYFNPKINKILLNVQSNICNSLIMQFQNNPEKSKYYSFKLIENEPYYISYINKKITNHVKKLLSSIFYKFGRVVTSPLYYIKKYQDKLTKTLRK